MKKYLLIFLKISLALLSLMFLIIIINYNFGNEKSRVDYRLAVSQKLRQEAYQLREKRYEEDYGFHKDFGEFSSLIRGSEIQDKKIRLSITNQTIRGAVSMDGSSYLTEIDPVTLEMKINPEPLPWNWRWYNWLGIGIGKVWRPESPTDTFLEMSKVRFEK